jgi:hypothetical protein
VIARSMEWAGEMFGVKDELAPIIGAVFLEASSGNMWSLEQFVIELSACQKVTRNSSPAKLRRFPAPSLTCFQPRYQPCSNGSTFIQKLLSSYYQIYRTNFLLLTT